MRTACRSLRTTSHASVGLEWSRGPATEAHLVDAVLPLVPYRQWVLSGLTVPPAVLTARSPPQGELGFGA